MSNIDVHVIHGRIVLVTPNGTSFHAHNVSEAQDLVTRVLSAVQKLKEATVEAQEPVQADRTRKVSPPRSSRAKAQGRRDPA